MRRIFRCAGSQLRWFSGCREVTSSESGRVSFVAFVRTPVFVRFGFGRRGRAHLDPPSWRGEAALMSSHRFGGDGAARPVSGVYGGLACQGSVHGPGQRPSGRCFGWARERCDRATLESDPVRVSSWWCVRLMCARLVSSILGFGSREVGWSCAQNTTGRA